MASTMVTVTWEHPETEEEFYVRAKVSGRYLAATLEAAAESPEVDILKVRETTKERPERRDVKAWILANEKVLQALELQALDAALEDADDGWTCREPARAEAE